MFYRPPVWSSGQSSWLQIQRSQSDSRRYQIFWEAVGLERGPLSLVSTSEELLGRKRSGSGLENREYGRRDSSRWPRGNLYPQKLTLTSSTSGGRSVGIVRPWTKATEWYYNKSTKNNTHDQTKYSTQNYINNQGHTTHNEYNATQLRQLQLITISNKLSILYTKQ
jgi:hypothetical protein